MNTPMAVRKFRAPMAAPAAFVARTTEHAGRLALMSGPGWSIARLFRPGLKVHALDWCHADHDSKHFDVRDSLSQRKPQAAAALFDRRHMKRRRVGNRLNVFLGVPVGIGPRNGCELPHV